MAKKEKAEKSGDGVLAETAKVVGKAAGKVASAVGATGETAEPPKPKTPPRPKVKKLEPKNKSRLPRKEKKAQQRASAKQL